MILYNITFNTEKSVEKVWTAWMNERYIPAVAQSEYIKEYKFLRMMHDSQSEGETYALQLFVDDLAELETCFEKNSSILAELTTKFGNKVVSFATMLEEI
ncbi:hypothetical protein FUAX_04050 [Fulvitalea axinellae]|uniref:DUF4286 family protein n=1 Tax=Fulvitalea axinellae TaxID=1182444 RepID=A0AAU9CWL3_9BACT|nr:hypothetical protein FUAX_04050 [Fulvitalea axinellae]